jgi:imidazolonepropionase-like amidohydrolase
LFTDRKPFVNAASEIFDLNERDKIKLYLSAISINNIYYIVRRYLGHKKTMKSLSTLLLLFLSFVAVAQTTYLLTPDRIFDGEQFVNNQSIVVSGEKITAIGSKADLLKKYPSATVIDLKGKTLMPGIIEGHSHLFLHPYNETPWNDQVLKESRSLRTARAVKHAEATLLSGVTTVRDLGTEGAEYDDVGLKQAIEQGIISGPRMIIATKALIATGSYGPSGFAADFEVPQGAEEADGIDDLTKAVRRQIGKGADVIKVYADYRWGPNGEARPTFTEIEIKLIVEIAASSGRKTVAHAATPEGMTRAINAGVSTIEHGDGGTSEVWKLMQEKDVCLCPTLAAGDAISQYRGWKKETDEKPERIVEKRKSFQGALNAGVKICFGGDVGVYPHGENYRELELMVEYGMKPIDVLKSATSINADVFELTNKIGRLKTGLLADIIAVDGNPEQNIKTFRNVKFVMKSGQVYVNK